MPAPTKHGRRARFSTGSTGARSTSTLDVHRVTICEIVVSASVSAGLLAFSVDAQADCQPNPPANGDTVTCTGPTTVPLVGPATNVTVNINAGAVLSLTAPGQLISVGAGARINNSGSVQVSQPTSIGIIATDGSILRNFGTIAANGYNSLSAVTVGNNILLSNEAGGHITITGELSAGLLVGVGDDSILSNAGRITLNAFQAGGLFAQEGSNHRLVNTSTGVIDSTLDQAFGINAQRGFAPGAGNNFDLRNEGTIITRGEASHGMLMNDLTNSVATNAGSITTSGGSSELINRAFGMFAYRGQGNTLLNAATGTITASGLGSSGIELAGSSGNTLRNDGTINISGAGAHGIYVLSGSGNTLENRGTLNVTGARGNGLRTDDGTTTLLNSGSILVGGADAFGVFMQGTNNVLTNTGTIRATGNNADGVLSNTVAGSLVSTIENTGSIISQNRFAIRGVNGQETVINSGVIRSDAGTAIDLRAGNDTVILRTGSRIVGLVDGGTGTDAVILQEADNATNDFANFETLRMTGTNWRWSGNGTFTATRVESGTLRIEGSLTSPVDIFANATLHVGNNSATGTVSGNIANSGRLIFDRSNDLAYAGLITGTGSVSKRAAGVLTLTADNTYGGDTIVEAGSLRIGAGATSGSVAGNIINRASLVFDRSDDSTYAGVLTSTGTLEKQGAGTLALTGAGGTSAVTTISTGTLRVGSSAALASQATSVASGATLDVLGSFTGTAGDDSLDVAGTLNGIVSLGAGTDTVLIHGSAAGTAQIDQGDYDDVFTMSGGSIESLHQAAGDDAATLTAGVINGALQGVNTLDMSGGTVGSVLLDIGNVAMTGGSILGALAGAAADDVVSVAAGSIGGGISLGDGANQLDVSGGSISAGVVFGAGTDRMLWSGGSVQGDVSMGAGNDALLIDRIDSATAIVPLSFDGGPGSDALAFNNAAITNVERLRQWESIDLRSGTRMVLDAGITLGDSSSGTGTLTIDEGSVLYGGNGVNAVIQPFAAVALASLVNRGTIDLSSAATPAAIDTLTIRGNYTAGSNLILDTVLGGDDSPSDRLIIDSGMASGLTRISIVNLGGAGDYTTADGIPLVLTQNGGTTAPDSFALNHAVAAGPFEYLLFRGGRAPGTDDNWYLRNQFIPDEPAPAPPPEPEPEPQALPPPPEPPGQSILPAPVAAAPQSLPVEPTSVVAADPDVPPPPITAAVSLLRSEVGTYSVLPGVLRDAAMLTAGTFNDRQGDGELLRDEDGPFSGAWARVLSHDADKEWSGDSQPGFSGQTQGVQAGLDVFSRSSTALGNSRVGAFFGSASIEGRANGLAVGRPALGIGTTDVDMKSGGLYLTHASNAGWYVDAVWMHTEFDGESRSLRGLSIDVDGHATTASLEAGWALSAGPVSIEPQAQVFWQRQTLDDAQDIISTVEFDSSDAWTGRLGARLIGSFDAAPTVRPYLDAYVWHGFGGSDRVVFGATPIVTEHEATSVELGAGITMQPTRSIGLFLSGSYFTAIDSRDEDSLQVNLGVRAAW